MGGPTRQFPSTSYTFLRRLNQKPSPDYDAALKLLLDTYWKPVYCLVRRVWGKSNEEAKDLTQDFFTSMVLEKSFVQKFVPERGSFRAFLKAAVNNFLKDASKSAGRQKRGGGTRILPMSVHEFDLSDMIPDSQSMTPDQVFDQAWKNVVLARAVEILKKQLADQGKEMVFEVFQRYDVHPADSDVSYKTVGQALGLTPDTVKNYLTAARAQFREAVEDVVADTVDSPVDLNSEIAELFGG